jgi:hypothetical protein
MKEEDALSVAAGCPVQLRTICSAFVLALVMFRPAVARSFCLARGMAQQPLIPST